MAIAGAPGLGGGWALTGRREELELIGACRATGRAGVLLAGVQGVGKTRLALEAIAEAQSDGAEAVWVSAMEATATTPLGALATVVPVEGADANVRIAKALDGLEQRAKGRQLVLGVDDAHHLDEESALVIHRAAGSGSAFMVLTTRDGMRMPDPVMALWKEGTCERVDVQALGRDESDLLVAAALGSPVEPATLGRLWDVTRGNPLFLREVVLAARQSGALAQVGSEWRWRRPLAIGARLLEVVESRLADVREDERAALDLLAVAGTLDLDLLTTMVPVAALESLERRELVVVQPFGTSRTLSLVHPVYVEAVRAQLPKLQARTLLRSLIEALRARGARTPADLVRLAAWGLEAGSAVEPELYVTASRAAPWEFERALADQLGEHGAALDSPAPLTKPADVVPLSESSGSANAPLAERLARAAWKSGRSFEAGITLLDALVRQHRLDDADALLAQLQAFTSLSGPQVAELASSHASLLFWGRDDAPGAVAVLRSGERATDDPSWRDELVRFRAGIAFQTGRPAVALAIVEAIRQRSDSTETARLRAGVTEAAAGAVMGRTDDAGRVLDGLLPVALKHADAMPHVLAELVVSRFFAHRVAGDFDAAQTLAEDCLAVAEDHGDAEHVAVFHGALGLVALDRGRLASAVQRLTTAARLMEEHDSIGFRAWALAGLAIAEAQRGQPDEAEATLAAATAARHGDRWFDADLQRAQAWILATRGHPTDAAAALLAAAHAAADHELHSFEVALLHDATRLGSAPASVVRLGELAKTVDGPLVDACAAHAAAAAAHDAAQLEVVSSAFAEIGATLSAAEAAADASAAYQRTGEGLHALACANHSHDLASLCEGARTPALASAALRWLTPRELQTAMLAARGLTNREIADHLVTSIRTVESYLYRSYAKLGITDRAQLAALAAGGRSDDPASRPDPPRHHVGNP